MAYQTNYSESSYTLMYANERNNPTDKLVTTLKTEKICACFASIFSNLAYGAFKEATVYIKEEYINDCVKEKKVIITEKSLKKWLNVLKGLGMKFHYEGEVQVPEITAFLGEGKKIWGITILKEENTSQTIKLFLNLVRYLYEDHFPKIIEIYNRLRLIMPTADSYSLIHFSNYMSNASLGGHNCFNDEGYHEVFKLVDKNLLKEKFLIDNDVTSYTNTLNNTPRDTIRRSSLKNLSNKDIIETFNKLKVNKVKLKPKLKLA